MLFLVRSYFWVEVIRTHFVLWDISCVEQFLLSNIILVAQDERYMHGEWFGESEQREEGWPDAVEVLISKSCDCTLAFLVRNLFQIEGSEIGVNALSAGPGTHKSAQNSERSPAACRLVHQHLQKSVR